MENKIDLKGLERLMLDHGAVIRAIPYEEVCIFEERYKDKYPEGTVFYDEKRKRNMLKVIKKNSQGGKFIITTKSDQGTIINYWGKPVIFYDTIEQAINSLIEERI